MLCEKCSSIHFKHVEECELIIQEPERLAMRKDDDWERTSNLYYIHSKDRGCLEKTADQGCHFCAMLQFCRFQCPDIEEEPALSFARDEIVLRRYISDTSTGRDGQAWHEKSRIVVRFQNKLVFANCRLQYPGKPSSTFDQRQGNLSADV